MNREAKPLSEMKVGDLVPHLPLEHGVEWRIGAIHSPDRIELVRVTINPRTRHAFVDDGSHEYCWHCHEGYWQPIHKE